MDPENPFETSSSLLAGEPNEGDTLDPVAVEPMAILGRCWEILTRDPGPVLGAVFISLVASLAVTAVQSVTMFGFGMVQGIAADEAGRGVVLALQVLGYLLQFFFFVLSLVINLYFALGTVRIFTRLARGLPANLMLLFGEWVRLPGGIAASLIVSVAMVIGLILFIVPGIIVALGFSLALYALVDQDLGPIEALRESWRLTDGHKLALFIVNLVMMVLALAVTCITCGIGYLAVVPILSLAQSVIYHSLVRLKGPRLEGM